MHKVVFLALFAASCSAVTIHLGNVEEKLRLLNPTFMMMEQLLNLEDENQCIEKLFCLLETEMAHEVNNPLKHYARFLTNVYEEIEPAAFDRVKGLVAKYPHISKLINAIHLGQSTGQTATCNTMYVGCPNEQSELVGFAKMMGDEAMGKFLPNYLAKTKRGDPVCDGSGVTCGLVGGGCAVCTVVTEGACGLLCGPEVAAVCAGTGIGCALG